MRNNCSLKQWSSSICHSSFSTWQCRSRCIRLCVLCSQTHTESRAQVGLCSVVWFAGESRNAARQKPDRSTTCQSLMENRILLSSHPVTSQRAGSFIQAGGGSALYLLVSCGNTTPHTEVITDVDCLFELFPRKPEAHFLDSRMPHFSFLKLTEGNLVRDEDA